MTAPGDHFRDYLDSLPTVETRLSGYWDDGGLLVWELPPSTSIVLRDIAWPNPPRVGQRITVQPDGVQSVEIEITEVDGTTVRARPVPS